MTNSDNFNRDIYAVIVAAGRGSRMKSDVPKQFLSLLGKPVLFYTINAFLKSHHKVNIIIVFPIDFMEEGIDMMATLFPDNNFLFVAGGEARFHSVQNGLKLIQSKSIVLVHDAARCLVTPDLIDRCILDVVKSGAVIPVIPCADSVRMIEHGGSNIIDRNKIRLVQTPQAFLSEIILPAFNTPFVETFTDEASVVEFAGNLVSLIEGEEANFKITNPGDIARAEIIINERVN